MGYGPRTPGDLRFAAATVDGCAAEASDQTEEEERRVGASAANDRGVIFSESERFSTRLAIQLSIN